MIKEITAAGKDILEAKENARAALGVGELADVQFEIIDAGTKGFLGFMKRPAKVRAYIELPDHQEKRPRHERPRKEKPAAAEAKEGGEEKSTEKNEGERTEGHKSAGQRRRRHKTRAQRREEAAERIAAEEAPQSKPKSEFIPEADLKMEKREVSEGEDRSFDFVKTLLSDIGLSAEAELYSCEDGTRRIAIVGQDASVLIGHHGDTLDALQYLANLASAQKNVNGERDKSRVTIDIEGYRKKREDTLRALARRMAAKALRNRRSVMLEPMTAYERRIIHSEIQSIEGVSTNSIGSDNNRKIVIFLTDKRPKEIFEEDEARRAKEFEETADEVAVEEIAEVETEDETETVSDEE